MSIIRLIVTLIPPKIKLKIKNGATRNKYIYIYRYLKAHRWKIRALYHGVRNYQNIENIKFNLRRDVHRIEKGLSYEKPKPIFAEDYILNVITSLSKSYKSKTIDIDTLEWTISVLEKYFSVVSHSDKIRKAYEQYREINYSEYEKNFFPYEEQTRPLLVIDYDELYKLALRRRSVRFFQDKQVERSKIKKAVELAKLSPSACNRIAFRYLYYDNSVVANQISQIPGGVRGYVLNQVFVLVGEYAGYFSVRDSTAPIIDASLSTMSLLYALETLGLGTVCINWPNEPNKEEEIRNILDLKESELVIMLIGVGYPKKEGKIPYSKKRANRDLLLVNERIIK